MRQRLTSKALTSPITFCFVIFCLISPYLVWAWTGRVVGVATGTTIKVLKNGKSVGVLLYGIDCSEESQPFREQVIELASKMVLGKTVKVYRMNTDRRGRTVALVSVDKALFNEELVKAGLAWVYNRYC